ncbi:MAG: hypothetical protein MUC59_10045, partial [Saprospiraceae bacterium]|nr:hypothetical protein [Saprospiraceae bacterium]
MGQVLPRVNNHLSMHSVWKKCKQGMVLTESVLMNARQLEKLGLNSTCIPTAIQVIQRVVAH